MDQGALLGFPYVVTWPPRPDPRPYPDSELHHLIPLDALEPKEPTR